MFSSIEMEPNRTKIFEYKSDRKRVAIICGFNTKDLYSTLFDIIHHYINCVVSMNIKQDDVYIYTDCSKHQLIEAYNKEMSRLNKKLVHANFPLNINNIIEFTNKTTFFKHIESVISSLNDKCDILFTLSSHGYTGIPSNYDSDGKGEYITVNGFRVTDEELFNNVVCKFKENHNILSLIDTCSSGTMLNLPFIYNPHINKVNRENNNACKSNILCISACRDGEYNSDSLSDDFGIGGGLTCLFFDHIRMNSSTVNVVSFIDYIKTLKLQQHPTISFS